MIPYGGTDIRGKEEKWYKWWLFWQFSLIVFYTNKMLLSIHSDCTNLFISGLTECISIFKLYTWFWTYFFSGASLANVLRIWKHQKPLVSILPIKNNVTTCKTAWSALKSRRCLIPCGSKYNPLPNIYTEFIAVVLSYVHIDNCSEIKEKKLYF